MRTFKFYQLDVFTRQAFSGNPLAVFPEALGISNQEMQDIATEMNLSETVFVLPSDKAFRRLRIFTPKQELPLAGHPVVGTWNLLANLGYIDGPENGSLQIEQELNLGVLPVELQFADGKVSKVVMTQGKFVASEPVTDAEKLSKLANALGLERKALIVDLETPVQTVSTGIRSLAVHVNSLKSLRNCKIDPNALSDLYLETGATGVFAFTFETIEKRSKAHARFFAPADGIPEDPATGSAAGSFSAYAVNTGAITDKNFLIEQGDLMGRPSRIFAEVTGTKGDIRRVRIGGESIIVAKGEIFLSESHE